jgi:hypothetical protein
MVLAVADTQFEELRPDQMQSGSLLVRMQTG